MPGDIDEHWDRSLIFAGASTGGEGAIYAARQYTDLGDSEGDSQLLAVVAIAPSTNQPGLANLQQTQLRSFFGIQGSRDGDVDERVFSAYDLIRTEGVEFPVDKALVYAHAVRHNDWGGCNPSTPASLCPTPKAQLLLEHYLIPYLRWVGRHDPSSRTLLTQAMPEIPVPLTTPELWPESDGVPLIARAVAVGTRACGSERIVIDSFDNSLPNISNVGTVSEVGFSSYQEGNAADIAKTPHVTGAVRAEWSAPGATIAWEISEDLRDGIGSHDHLNLRVGTLPTVGGPPECESDTTVAVATLRLVDGSGTAAALPLSSYVSDIVPDIRSTLIGGQPACIWSEFMTTARIPMTSFCAAAKEFDYTDIARIELSFDAPPTDALGKVLLDSLEWTRTPDDEDQACQP